jgi:hypothetical protein
MTPELRFCHWLRGYMDARRIGQTAIEGLTGQDASRIYAELQFATGDMVKLGRNEGWIPRHDELIGTRADVAMKMQMEANKHAQQVLACAGQTIPLAEQRRVEAEQAQGVDLGNAVNLGAGYGIPRGVR